MSSEQVLEAQVIPQDLPLMISDHTWSRMCPRRRRRAYKTQMMIDTIRQSASVEIDITWEWVTLKFKSNKTIAYQQSLEYLNKYYTYTSHSFNTTYEPKESHRYRIYKIEFRLLPPWQPWEYIPDQNISTP